MNSFCTVADLHVAIQREFSTAMEIRQQVLCAQFSRYEMFRSAVSKANVLTFAFKVLHIFSCREECRFLKLSCHFPTTLRSYVIDMQGDAAFSRPPLLHHPQAKDSANSAYFLLVNVTLMNSSDLHKYLLLNLLKPTGHVMHQQFNIQKLYALPTLYLCVLYLSENKQRLVPLTA